MSSATKPVPPDERTAIAVQLLRLLALFGIVVAISDYLTGNFVISSAAVGISVLAPLVLLLSRWPRFARLPLRFSYWLLFAMFLLGSFTQLPYRPERAVWITLFPVAYFYLGGLRLGAILSLASLVILLTSYVASPALLGRQATFAPYAFGQCVGAFVLITVLAYLYERIRTRQTERLEAQAERDTLSGLLNRRGFVAQAERIRQQALRFGHAYAVVLLDVDDFKQVNDRWGHAAGDELLVRVAALLGQCTRKADLLARWGGEEFILLLPQITLEHACAAAEKMRALVQAESIDHGPVTISVGVALHDAAENLEATINRADRAMYRAKEAGKNRVVCE